MYIHHELFETQNCIMPFTDFCTIAGISYFMLRYEFTITSCGNLQKFCYKCRLSFVKCKIFYLKFHGMLHKCRKWGG